ncbi:MAG: class II aldolase/adducin family protein [Desulfovibrionaceae bacterium]|nr:class II aldolase/adducin family protein [Desulfovibrionaceae bacterium]
MITAEEARTLFDGSPVRDCATDMARVCREAWRQYLVSGCNSNASCRLPAPYEALLCVTASGSAKGRLSHDDCCLVEAGSGQCLAGRAPSTELGLHLGLYAALPGCRAVLHSHPRHLLALSLVLEKNEDFLRLPLFEAATWRARLAFAPALPPGGQALAEAVTQAALGLPGSRDAGAVWMAGHGLCCWGASLDAALTMSEELEHLAAVQLLALPRMAG